MKRKILATVLVLSLVLLFSTILMGCSGAKITGKYYEELSDGTLKESSWIELVDKTNWQDDEGLGGTYEISGKTIKLFIEGEELCDGTIENGVMVIEFFGTITYKKKGSSSGGTGEIISET